MFPSVSGTLRLSEGTPDWPLEISRAQPDVSNVELGPGTPTDPGPRTGEINRSLSDAVGPRPGGTYPAPMTSLPPNALNLWVGLKEPKRPP